MKDELFDELAKHRWAIWSGWALFTLVCFVALSVVVSLLDAAGEWLFG